LPQSPPFIGRLALDRSLDVVEASNPLESLMGDRRPRRGVHVEELPPRMSPACRLDNAAGLVEAVEARVSIGLEHPREERQMGKRPFASAVR